MTPSQHDDPLRAALTREHVRSAYREAAGRTHNSTDLLDAMTDNLNAGLAASATDEHEPWCFRRHVGDCVDGHGWHPGHERERAASATDDYEPDWIEGAMTEPRPFAASATDEPTCEHMIPAAECRIVGCQG